MIEERIMKIIKNQKILNFLVNSYFAVLFLVMIFGRSFIGLTISGYRIGEIIILIAFLTTFLIFYPDILEGNLHRKSLLVHRLLVISFFIYVFISEGSLLSTYTYKSSSYLWTLIFIYFGVFLYRYKISIKFDLRVLLIPLPLTYILSSVYYPQIFQNIFLNYSDVFDFLKASDLLLVFVVTNYLYFIISDNYKSPFIYLIISGAIFFPYMAYKSKGAILPGIIFLLLMLFQYRKLLIKKILFSSVVILIGALLFLFSTVRTFGGFESVNYEIFFSEREENIKMHERFTNFQSIVKTQPERYDPETVPERYETQNIKEVSEDIYINIIPPEKEYKNVTHFWIFTLADNRLYSNETNIDYRLQIWQDVLIDLRLQNKLFSGYSYNEIIPAMTPAERRGWDGTNENVHNYLINIFARGGIIHLTLFILFYYFIINFWHKENKNYLILVYILPIFVTSLFDVTMESVRYPLIFFSFLGFFLNYETKNKEDLI